MRCLALTLLLLTVAAGCAPAPHVDWTWVCPGGRCAPVVQADNACLAQANAALARRDQKRLIWGQCMYGQGYQIEACVPADATAPRRCGFPGPEIWQPFVMAGGMGR